MDAFEVSWAGKRQVFPTARAAVVAAKVGINERRAAIARIEAGYELDFYHPTPRTIRRLSDGDQAAPR
jgi:hypothetical protein